MPVDKNGKEVKQGSKVRIVKVDPRLLDRLSEDEIADVNSMIGEVFEVAEIDEQGGAWVEKWWDEGNGKVRSHSLSLCASEMELVE